MAEEDKDPVTGIPKYDLATARGHACKQVFSTVMVMVVFQAIGAGIACAIYFWGDTENYNMRLEAGKKNDMCWPAFSVCVFAFTVVYLNIFPMFYKEQFMKGGNFRANQFVYRQATSPDGSDSSAVILYDTGIIGNYNRGNRSIGHFLENCLPIIVTLPIGFTFFPFPTAMCFCVYALGRIIYQVGYTAIGFGAHFPGFLMDRFTTFTMVALCFIAFIKMM